LLYCIFFLDYYSFLFYTCLDLDGLGWVLSDAVVFFRLNVSWLNVCVYVGSYAVVYVDDVDGFFCTRRSTGVSLLSGCLALDLVILLLLALPFRVLFSLASLRFHYFIPSMPFRLSSMPPRASCFHFFSVGLIEGPTPSTTCKFKRRLISPLLSFSFPIGTTDYTNAPQRPVDSTRLPPAPLASDIRAAQVFHDATTIPTSSSIGPSMAPLLRDTSLSALGRHHTIATSSPMDHTSAETNDDNISPSNEDLFGQLPDGKRRTFILVEDPQRGARVRVKVMLDKVNMDEIPDSYRMSNAVYPRTYFPVQMKDAPGTSVPNKRFFRDDTEHGDESDATVSRTSVLAPSLDGEREIDVPQLSRRRHHKEVMLNDLGYRMSWSQSRVFAGRTLFLQRSRKYHSLPPLPVFLS
jgi:hypothetical protein